ncbi:unnamed protein product [Urochloa humidicola]
MGEPRPETSVDKLFESMQKLFTQLAEQTQQKSKGPAILDPNPVKLSGPGNYFSWSRNASLILGSYGLKNFLEDNSAQPGDKVDLEQWEQNQQRVMVWLLGSMESSVREQVENLQTPTEVWKEIGNQFSGKTNKMQVTRVLHEMRNLKQGQKSITEYAGELKRLYRDLEFFHPFKCDDANGMTRLREWFQPILVQTFLEGLNSEFDFRRQMIYSAADWPTLDEAISSILEEETRLSSQVGVQQVNTDNRAALSTQAPSTPIPPFARFKNDQANAPRFGYRRKQKIVCDHCGREGHLEEKCFDLIGYPPGWPQRQRGRQSSSNARGIKQDRVHVTSTTGELPTVAAQALEEFKSKLMVASAEGPSGSVSSFHASKGTEDRESTWDWDRA